MSVERALSLLAYLAHHPGDHGVRSLAAELHLSPSTTFRLLGALTKTGFARRDEATGHYAIGVQAVQLGLAAMASFDLTVVAPPVLREITAETGETSFLATLDDGDVVYLAKEEGSHAIRTSAQLGSRRPAHCTALGKAMLARMPVAEVESLLRRKGMPAVTSATITDVGRFWEELAEVRLRGFAVDREEIAEGLACIGASVHDHTGATVAAISLAGPVARILPREEGIGRRIATAAAEISRALGYSEQRARFSARA